jgi:hypothetical protein
MASRPNQGKTRAKTLTPRQTALTKNLLNGTTITEAARRAGYSRKNLAQSGHQALNAIRLRVPELMDELGLTERELIEKHLVPLLSAKTTKYFQNKGKVTDKRSVPDHDTRLQALDLSFKLRGAYTPKDPATEAQFGVKVIVIDIPRPQIGVKMADIRPGDLLPLLPSNGHKPQK